MTQSTPNVTSHDGADRGVRRSPLEAIPLLIRIVFCLALFVGVILVGLPWLAYRFDVRFPQYSVDFGIIGAVFGWAIFAVSFAGYLASSFILTQRGEGAYIEFDPPKKFVATGPYRWVRNPVVVFAAGALLGEAVAFSSTGILFLFVVMLALANAQVVLMEEPLLRKRFGQDYIDYMARVPRWIPRRPRPSDD